MSKNYQSVSAWKENVIFFEPPSIYLIIHRDNQPVCCKVVEGIDSEFNDFLVISEIISKELFGLVIAESIQGYYDSGVDFKTYRHYPYSTLLDNPDFRPDPTLPKII